MAPPGGQCGGRANAIVVMDDFICPCLDEVAAANVVRAPLDVHGAEVGVPLHQLCVRAALWRGAVKTVNWLPAVGGRVSVILSLRDTSGPAVRRAPCDECAMGERAELARGSDRERCLTDRERDRGRNADRLRGAERRRARETATAPLRRTRARATPSVPAVRRGARPTSRNVAHVDSPVIETPSLPAAPLEPMQPAEVAGSIPEPSPTVEPTVEAVVAEVEVPLLPQIDIRSPEDLVTLRDPPVEALLLPEPSAQPAREPTTYVESRNPTSMPGTEVSPIIEVPDILTPVAAEPPARRGCDREGEEDDVQGPPALLLRL